MGQFNINISGGNAPYTLSVKKVGDSTERWISGGTTGSGLVTFTSDTGTVSYNVVVSKNGCTTANGSFSLTCITPTSPVPTTPVSTCDIVINNIIIQCNGNNSATVTVFANSPSGKTLRYGILGFVDFQTSNVFELVNSDGNGYTFIVAELGHENTCRATLNRIVTCVTPVSPVPTPISPVPTPVNNCNLSISSVNVSCIGANNGTVTVNVNNTNNYTLQYQIDGYITWQSSNVFSGITNSGSGYTVRVRNAADTSCEAVSTGVIVDCITPTPTPVTPVPTPVSCSLSISGVSTSCNGANNGTFVINVNNPNNYSLQYKVDGFTDWQNSGIITGITNGSNYTVRVRNANNISCEVSLSNIAIECNNIPTPISPVPSPISPVPSPVTPTPISPVPTPVSPVPTPITPTPTGCPTITISVGSETISGNNYSRVLNINGGSGTYTVNMSNVTYVSGGTVSGNSNLVYNTPYLYYDMNGFDAGFFAEPKTVSLYVTDSNGCVSNTITFDSRLKKSFTVTNNTSSNISFSWDNISTGLSTPVTLSSGETSSQFCTHTLSNTVSPAHDLTINDLGICI